MLIFRPEQLREVGRRVFAAAGAPDDIARLVADSLVESNLAGHDSHGVIRIPAYVDRVQKGHFVADARPAVLRETPTTALVSGNWGFGQVTALFATGLAIAKAREHQLAAVSVVQCNHIGRLGEYVEIAAREGLVAMVTAGSYPGGAAAPFGGATRALGTNPFAFGVPARAHQPMIVDFATTVVAEGKLQVYRAKRQPIPPGWILDREGKPSTDAEDFYRGGTILPFGGHKGYALAMVAEVLSGTLGGNEEARGEMQGHGAFVLVLDPGAFRDRAEFGSSNDALFDKVKSVRAAPGFGEVMVPGEPETRSRSSRRVEGIPVPEETWESIRAVASRLGVDGLVGVDVLEGERS